MTRTFRILWVLFALFIVYGATIPFRFTTDWAFIGRKLSGIPLSILTSPETHSRLSIPDTVQNILFFVPFGVLGLLAGGNHRRSAFPRILFVTVLAAMFSLAVEGLQLLTLDRVASLADVGTNTAGALAGAMAARLAQLVATPFLRRIVQGGLVDATTFYPLMVAAIVLGIGAWQPFDVTLDVGTVASKVRALQRDLWQFGPLSDEGIALLRHALFAVSLCAWLDALGRRRVALLAAGVGLVSAFGLEASQILIASRQPGLTDAVVQAAGALAGVIVWLVGCRGTAGRVWLVVLTVATAAGAAVQMLSPFTVAPVYHFVGWLPLFGYYVHTTFDTLSHVLELLLIYFPLGFCFARVMTGGTRAAFVIALVTLVIAVPIEYMQGWIVGRFPDATDVALSVLGGWLGVWVGGSGASAFARAASSLAASSATSHDRLTAP